MSRHDGPVVCMAGCKREWPRDPVLAVECPDCHANPGVPCKRPSGHGAFGGVFHRARDIKADQEGHYGSCPLGKCGLANKAAREASAPTQPTLL